MALTGDSYVEAYDVSNGPAKLVTRIDGGGAHAFRAQGDKRHLFVSNRTANSISRIDLQTLAVTDTFAVPGGPDCMDVLADGKTLLVTSRWARKLTVVDLEQKKVVQQVPVGSAARRLDAEPCADALSRRSGRRPAWPRCCRRWPVPPPAGPGGRLRQARHLTFDTGHMGVAPLVADVLARHHVKVTFFLANERTLTDGASLDDQWAPWWKARAAEGHAFGSHTYDHVYWQGDLPDGKFRVKPSAGPQTGKVQT